MTTIRVDLGLCHSHLPVLTQGGVELPPKVCIREKGHTGPHSDGSAVWLNIVHHNNVLDRRFTPKG